MGQVKPFSLLWESGAFYLAVVFCLPGRGLFIRLPGGGQNHFFFCTAKEKVVLDSEKENGRPVEILGWCGTTGWRTDFVGLFLG